jgi:hypothetical protein
MGYTSAATASRAGRRRQATVRHLAATAGGQAAEVTAIVLAKGVADALHQSSADGHTHQMVADAIGVSVHVVRKWSTALAAWRDAQETRLGDRRAFAFSMAAPRLMAMLVVPGALSPAGKRVLLDAIAASAGARVVENGGVPGGESGPSLHEAALEVAAAAGVVSDRVLEATRSASRGGKKITPAEAGVVARACREVVREADEVACSMEMVANGGGA